MVFLKQSVNWRVCLVGSGLVGGLRATTGVTPSHARNYRVLQPFLNSFGIILAHDLLIHFGKKNILIVHGHENLLKAWRSDFFYFFRNCSSWFFKMCVFRDSCGDHPTIIKRWDNFFLLYRLISFRKKIYTFLSWK